jgi:hypothetical protein
VRLHQQIGARKEAGYGAQARQIAAELAVHFTRGRDPPGVPSTMSTTRGRMPWSAVPIRRQSPISPRGWRCSRPSQIPPRTPSTSWIS